MTFGPGNLPDYFLDFDAPEAEEAVEILETQGDTLGEDGAQTLYDALESGDDVVEALAAAKATIAAKS